MKLLTPLVVAACVLCGGFQSVSQVVSARFSTSVYGWEKFDTVGSSSRIVRAYQTALIDVAQDDISFHTNLLASGPFSDDATLRIAGAFLRWKNAAGLLDIQAGRMAVFAGVGTGTLDGALVRARFLENRVTVTGYGGATVSPDLRSKGFTDLGKNFFAGGQIRALPIDGMHVGISYTNRNRRPDDYTALRPDSLFNAVLVTVTPQTRKEQVLGADARYGWRDIVSAYGRFDYDINMKRSLRGEMSARVNPTRELAFTVTGIYREPRVWYNTFFSFLPAEPIREAEGGVEYTVSKSISAFGRLAYISYRDDRTRRLTAGVYYTYASLRFSGTNGYAGELASVSLDAQLPLWEKKLVPTAGFSYASYRALEGVSAKEDLLAGSLGALLRPLPQIALDAQLQWIRNPIAKSDLRGFGRISYWFSRDFGTSVDKEKGE